jgi:hypothetical protein
MYGGVTRVHDARARGQRFPPQLTALMLKSSKTLPMTSMYLL